MKTKKQWIHMVTLLLVCFLALTACQKTTLPDPQTITVTEVPVIPEKSNAIATEEKTLVQDDVLGVSLELPKKALDDWTILYGPFDQSATKMEFSPQDGSYVCFMPMVTSRILFSIEYFEQAQWDAWMAEGKTAEAITNNPINEEIGRQSGMVYIYTAAQADEQGMDDATVKTYREMLALLPTIRESIKLIPRAASKTAALPEFTATDLAQNKVDSSLFAKADLTLINIWATFCGPCIEEMPDLEELSKNMPKGTQLIGIVGDAVSSEYIALAKKIAEETGVTFINVVPDKALLDYINSNIVGYPTTLIVDAKGNVVGDALVGARGRKEYEAELTTRMNMRSNTAGGKATDQPTDEEKAPANDAPTNDDVPSKGAQDQPGPAPEPAQQ